LKLGPAAILSQNPIFEIASINAAVGSSERPLKKKSQEVGDVRGKKRFYRKGSPNIFSRCRGKTRR
jgi:hypothetical protein